MANQGLEKSKSEPAVSRKQWLKIMRNAVYLLVGNVGVRALTAIATILVARYLGAENYGALAVALAIANLAGYCTDLGLTQTFIREGSMPRADIRSLTGSALWMRLLFSVIVTAVVVIAVPFIYPEIAMQRIIFWATLPAVWGAALQGVGSAYFQLSEKMQYTALIKGSAALLNCLALLASIYWQAELIYFAAAYGFSQLLGGVLSFALILGRFSLGSWQRGLLGEISYFTLAGMLTMALPQVGTLILQKVSVLQEVGYFAAAYRIPGLLYMIPGTVAGAFYPLLFRQGHLDIYNHANIAAVQLKVMTILSVTLALPFLLYPEFFMGLLFGSSWRTGSPVAALQILSCLVVLQSLHFPLGDALTTRGMQRRRTYCLLVGLLSAIALQNTLGAGYGAAGGAAAVVGTELIIVLCLSFSLPGSLEMLKQNINNLLLAVVIGLTFMAARHQGLGPAIGLWLPSLLYLAAAIWFSGLARQLWPYKGVGNK